VLKLVDARDGNRFIASLGEDRLEEHYGHPASRDVLESVLLH